MIKNADHGQKDMKIPQCVAHLKGGVEQFLVKEYLFVFS